MLDSCWSSVPHDTCEHSCEPARCPPGDALAEPQSEGQRLCLSCNSGNPLLQQKGPEKSKTWTTACGLGRVLTDRPKLWITTASAAVGDVQSGRSKRVFHNMSADLWQRG